MVERASGAGELGGRLGVPDGTGEKRAVDPIQLRIASPLEGRIVEEALRCVHDEAVRVEEGPGVLGLGAVDAVVEGDDLRIHMEWEGAADVDVCD